MNTERIIACLTHDEGLGKPGYPGVAYTDTVGKVTVGIGRNLTDVGISYPEAVNLLPLHTQAGELLNILSLTGVGIKNSRILFASTAAWEAFRQEPLTQEEMHTLAFADIERARLSAKSIFDSDWDELPNFAQEVCIHVVFNLGEGTFRKFKNAIAAIRSHDWDTAAAELLDSRAARQTGQRYHRYAEVLRTQDTAHFQAD